MTDVAEAREKARMAIEDAVYRCLEAGMTVDEVLDEAQYAIDSATTDDAA